MERAFAGARGEHDLVTPSHSRGHLSAPLPPPVLPPPPDNVYVRLTGDGMQGGGVVESKGAARSGTRPTRETHVTAPVAL